MPDYDIKHLKAKLNGRRCFLIMDQAGWHSSKGLKIPPNIKPLYLPSHSPKLNPVERLWNWLKRNTIRNQFFQTLDEVMDAVANYIKKATAPVLKRMCGCNYI
ncbi:MAG: transposase [Holophagales bacterium]|jgi:transposase|nr:transposase [Holophagales bacterium]